MTDRETRHGRYEGPPGDTREYWMPRDHARWEASWSEYLGSQAPDPLADEPARGGRRKSTPESREAKKRHDEAIAYIRDYTGSFGLILDIRASERWGTKYMRLSERQVEAVLASRDRDNEARLNTELWQDDEYLRWEAEQHAPEQSRSADPQDTGVAAQPAPRSTQSSDVADGWYVVDGEPWKVQWNRERTRKYAKRLVERDWEYVPGGLGIVARKGEPMTLEVAQQYGKLYGVCAICGRTLTDEKSIADGIGPVCANNIMGGS